VAGNLGAYFTKKEEAAITSLSAELNGIAAAAEAGRYCWGGQGRAVGILGAGLQRLVKCPDEYQAPDPQAEANYKAACKAAKDAAKAGGAKYKAPPRPKASPIRAVQNWLLAQVEASGPLELRGQEEALLAVHHWAPWLQ
jgi:hypothetical protein